PQQEADLRGAHLQGADLRWARLQGAVLHEAHLQEAVLRGAYLQGAVLRRAYLQGADLMGAHLQGAVLDDTPLQAAVLSGADLQGAGALWTEQSFAERMNAAIGKESDLSGVVFEGGLSREDVDSLVTGLSDKKANDLRIKLEPHVGRPEVLGVLPKNCGATLGAYSKEEAEQWIAEYNKAMSEVPEEPKKQ
ncbi:MAG: pentapeptide repeat-containing protein, partial [Nitrospira sp.]|nr:pentapeptide repeat-containing protein [Nitrospira sp.]